MSTWYSKELGAGAEAEAKAGRIQSALVALIDAINRPDGMGVFLQIEEDSEMNTVYFTPETGRLALSFGAEPCEKPVDDGYLSFIDGDRRQWHCRHFYPVFIVFAQTLKRTEQRNVLISILRILLFRTTG